MDLYNKWILNAQNAVIESKAALIGELEHKVALGFGDRDMIAQLVCVLWFSSIDRCIYRKLKPINGFFVWFIL